MICETTSVRSSEGLRISARVRQSSVTSNTLWANLNFFGQIIIQKYFVLCPRWSSGPYISRNFLIWTHFVNASWKKSDLRMHISSTTQGINVVKVRFTMRFSSRKLSNDKVITPACYFWRQIACSFQVVSGNILFLGNKRFEIPPFFQTRPGDLGKKVHACSLRFSALKTSANIQIFPPSYGRSLLIRFLLVRMSL